MRNFIGAALAAGLHLTPVQAEQLDLNAHIMRAITGR
jgi:hypothetical protein